MKELHESHRAAVGLFENQYITNLPSCVDDLLT